MNATIELDPEVRELVDDTVEHFNSNHADTVLLLTRYAAGCADAMDAEAIHVDSGGVDIAVRVGADRVPGQVRLEFGAIVSTALEVQGQVHLAIARAREAAGDAMPLTSLELEGGETTAIRTFDTTVAEVSRVNDSLVRVVLAGGLDEYVTLGGDQFLYLMVPRPGGDALPVGYSMADFMAQSDDERPLGAYYTVRHWDEDRKRITLWMVLHGHDDGLGGWASRCTAGDRVLFWGPRHGFSPIAEASRHLLIADESGFAAVASLLDEMAPGQPSTVVLETTDEAHTIDLSGHPAAIVHWLFRGDAEPGVGTQFVDTVRSLDLDPNGLVAFGAGESRQVTAIRKYLRHEVGLSSDQVFMVGYWRRTAH
ncbi:MAG: SIP domain-containing protein [Ilumatobacteraceae bacterium]